MHTIHVCVCEDLCVFFIVCCHVKLLAQAFDRNDQAQKAISIY